MNTIQYMQNLANQARHVQGTDNLISGPISLNNTNPSINSPINLSDITQKIPDIKDPVTGDLLARFKFLTGLPVSIINTKSKPFVQLGVKDNKKFNDEVMAMSSALFINGWDLNLGYSMYDMEGEPIDGRVKTISGKNLSMNCIPAAVFEWLPHVTESMKFDVYSRENVEKWVTGTDIGRTYFEINGIAQITIHQSLRTPEDIEDWVENVSGAKLRFCRPEDKGQITAIKNTLLSRLKAFNMIQENEEETFMTLTKTKEGWLAWLNSNYTAWELTTDNLTCVDQSEYAERFFVRHILPNIAKGSVPNLITYTGQTDVFEVEKRRDVFYKKLDSVINNYWNSLEKLTGQNVTRKDLYVDLGSVPQYIGSHHEVNPDGTIDRNSLVPRYGYSIKSTGDDIQMAA